MTLINFNLEKKHVVNILKNHILINSETYFVIYEDSLFFVSLKDLYFLRSLVCKVDKLDFDSLFIYKFINKELKLFVDDINSLELKLIIKGNQIILENHSTISLLPLSEEEKQQILFFLKVNVDPKNALFGCHKIILNFIQKKNQKIIQSNSLNKNTYDILGFKNSGSDGLRVVSGDNKCLFSFKTKDIEVYNIFDEYVIDFFIFSLLKNLIFDNYIFFYKFNNEYNVFQTDLDLGIFPILRINIPNVSLIENKFPFNNLLKVDKKQFIKILKIGEIISKNNDISDYFILDIQEDSIHFLFKNSHSIYSPVLTHLERTKNIKLALNARKIKDIIEVLDEKEINIYYNNLGEPIKITENDMVFFLSTFSDII